MKQNKCVQLISLGRNCIKRSNRVLIRISLVAIVGLMSVLLTPPLAISGGSSPDLMVISNIGVYLDGIPPGAPPPPGVTFIDINTDDLIIVEFADIAGMPEGIPQHAWVTPDGKTVYLTLDASPPEPLNIVVLSVKKLDFDSGVAKLKLKKVIKLEEAGDLSSYPLVRDHDLNGNQISNQLIAGWTQPTFTQAHGPSFTPDFKFTYVTQWTDNKYRGLRVNTNKLIKADPIMEAEDSRQTHGLNFNPNGTLALATGYYYDHNEIDVYQPVNGPGNNEGDLEFLDSITLHDVDTTDNCADGDGAFTHYTTWVDDRFAYTATMQFDELSIADDAGVDIVGPSIWLLDVNSMTADCVKGTATAAAGLGEDGVHLSASDLLLVDNGVRRKLYIAEEDTLDGSFGDSGSVSVFDIDMVYGDGAYLTDPQFVVRLESSDEFPSDFAVAHGLTKSNDGRFVYVSSYYSSFIIKIDTLWDTVVHVFDASDGLAAPHGGFVAGDVR